MTIKSAHAKTCKWLLRSFQYKDWLDINKVDEHHGFLWIKGKAGAGKSTLMKFATANARKTMKEVIILSFFFNARGEDLEKSSIGTYRSLLLQLLEAIPESQSIFDSIGIPPSAVGKDQQWSIELLRTLLEQAIQSLGHASVVCFIDALDECEEEQVRVMIQFLEHIADVAVSNEVHFKVCFSSRHYPHVTIRNGLELVLEGHEGHAQDITNYIETEIKIGKSKAAQRIRTELQEKASGVFMWVVLVVDILNREFDRGQVHALRKKLQEIPGDLHELFRDILTRDSHNKELLVLCIQWVLFARKPLSPDQLYHALLSSVNPDATSDWDPEDVTKDDMKRYILNASKGLTEATTSKDPRIQFIHESVRDFLLKENGLSKIWPEFINNFDGKSHERLKQCCVDYIRIADATTLQVPNDLSKITSQEITDLRNSAAQLVPFLEYAVHNVLYHADAAESSGIFQAGFLANFPIPQWVRFDNLFEKHKVRRHTQNVSLLYLLAEFDMANLVKFLDLASQCLNIEDERYGCALFAAAAVGSEKTLRLCMDSINAQRASNSLVAGTDDQHCQRTSAKRSEKRDFVYSKSKTLLLNAVELVDVELFTLLLRSGKVNVDAKQSEAVLHKIVKNGWAMAVRPLLSASPYSAVSIVVNSKYRYDTSALYLAAEKGNEAMVRVLLDNGADVNMQDGRYGTAILIASARGHKEVAKLLLDRGADINLQGGNYGNALQAAAVDGHKDVVELLLDRGANINLQGGYYGNALYAAAVNRHKDVVELLLDRGADINLQGGNYGNALQAAAVDGHKDVIELLLDRGVDINLQGGNYGNALQAAAVYGHKDVVELLLDRGADINLQGGNYGNALQAAAVDGHKDVIELLLDRGADINLRGGNYGNALRAAAVNGHKDVVELLLDRGADINLQGGNYGSALQAAALANHKDVVELLLDRGADINLQGGNYGNALQAASRSGHKDIVMLLLEKGAHVNAQGGEYVSAL
ncbi:hypothetical protein N0V86_004273 [Didymella sp. IMI 355093]|nr:hypothetical protein N0V86_004273 [Didymella sp. IMI 355093]